MLHLRDADVERLLTLEASIDALGAAFRSHALGRAAMQPRVRTAAGPLKLSTLGALLPEQHVAGAKVYTTVDGRFTFVVVLFAAADGRVLATLDGAALTRLRTAATSVLAGRALARPDAGILTIFGTGTQARTHAAAFAQAFHLTQVRVVGRDDAQRFAREIEALHGVRAAAVSMEAGLDGADLIVTATRAATPVLSGERIAPGAFIAAVGSSRPDARELDAAAIARCNAIVVEWKEQARHEAGDLVLAGSLVDWDRVVELGSILNGAAPGRAAAPDIVLFKSVGVGLEDIALADAAYRRATGAH
jgi:ornithine cyclodeaminase